MTGLKPVVLRPRARDDRRAEVAWYRREAGTPVADKLVRALERAQGELARQPAIGSPTLGEAIGVPGLRTWAIRGFPLSYWYFERPEQVDIVRLVGQRQDAEVTTL